MKLSNLSRGIIIAASIALPSKADNSRDVHPTAENLTGQGIAPIEVVGSKFFHSGTGDQFFIKGLAYQLSRKEGETYDRTTELPYIDLLANTTACLRDLENFKELGINVIRVFQLDTEANHDVCMNALAEAGIYVLADLGEPERSINRENPTWTVDLMRRYHLVVDSLARYKNVMGFFAGNEVTTSATNVGASPFVRAAIRDTKAYIRKQGYRPIPVGYATNDDDQIRNSLTNYFACDHGLGDDSNADFMGLNMYEWCGYSSYVTSGYRERTKEYKDYPIPIFFSEYGCNTITPRPFTEIEVLYGPQMTGLWSGGIAYEYFDHINKYGIVKESANGKLSKLADYNTLKKHLNAVNAVGISKSEYNPGTAQTKCNAQSKSWSLPHVIPPTPDKVKCDCMRSRLQCVVSPFNAVDYDELMLKVCAKINCSEIESSGTLSVFGEYADCGTEQRLSYALTKYFMTKDSDPSVCNFEGQALYVSNTELANRRVTQCPKNFDVRLEQFLTNKYSKGNQTATKNLYGSDGMAVVNVTKVSFSSVSNSTSSRRPLPLALSSEDEEDNVNEDLHEESKDKKSDASLENVVRRGVLVTATFVFLLMIPR